MNESPLQDPAWQKIAEVAPYLEAIGTCFLVGLGLILVLQIVSVALQCRALSPSRNSATGRPTDPACSKEADALTERAKPYGRGGFVRV